MSRAFYLHLFHFLFTGCVTQSKYDKDILDLEIEKSLEVLDLELELMACQDKSVHLNFDTCEEARMMRLRTKDHYRRGIITKSVVMDVREKYYQLCN